jgi:hypothetical protein
VSPKGINSGMHRVTAAYTRHNKKVSTGKRNFVFLTSACKISIAILKFIYVTNQFLQGKLKFVVIILRMFIVCVNGYQ